MLEVGQKIPHVMGLLEDGSPYDLAGPSSGPRVIYFYPKAFTPGCTKEACSFRDAHEELVGVNGAEVYAVSGDDPATQAEFKARYRLPFHLVSDSDGSIVKTFGVRLFGGLLPVISRATFIVDASGTVRAVFVRQLSWDGHVKAALEALKSLAKPAAPAT
jgi:thioredoxin-dependent peroxiredoxin